MISQTNKEQQKQTKTNATNQQKPIKANSNQQEPTGYPSIDKPWLQFYTDEELSKEPVKTTVYTRLYKNNHAFKNDIALLYFGRKISYGELFRNIDMCKAALVANGVRAGDKVALMMASTPELVYIVFALCRIGAVADLLSPLFTEEQMVDRTNETDAKLMIVLDQLFGKVSSVIDKLCIEKYIIVDVTNSMPGTAKFIASKKMNKHIKYTDSIVNWNNFLKVSLINREDFDYQPDYPLIMVYSSGSTGAQKAIVLTNDGINATISHYADTNFPFKRGNTFLQMVPIFASTGIVLSVMMPVCLGITAVLEPVYSKESFSKDIKKYRPNMTLGSTSLWLYVLSDPKMRGVDLSKFTYPITGGEQVLPETEAAINRFLMEHGCTTPLIKGYGMCELGGTVSTSSPTHSKPSSIGYPISHVIVSAFNENHEEMKYNERGEICVISPACMKEYFKNKKSTDDFFYEDTKGFVWGRTGDIGYVDEDGDVYILGRATDSFVSKSGDTIYNFDIEAVIRESKYVKDCEVVGISKDNYQIPVAHIIKDDDCTISDKELISQIHNQCKEKLSDELAPHGYKIVAGFPVNKSGKRNMEAIRNDLDGIVWQKNP